MNFTERRANFQRLMKTDKCYHPGSVFDPLSGRIAQEIGFEMGMFAGSTASLVVLGAPDLVVLTLTEFADQAMRISRACDIPLVVDADHGYGNALNVARTVEELESAGVAAITIEDTALPLGFGATKRNDLLSVEEGVGKMRAALAARQDPNLVIVGRTSAVTVTGVEDAIARSQAYEAAGVDAVFLAGVKTRAQLDAISAATTKPLALGYPGAEILDLDYLASRRVKICLQGHTPIQAAVLAIHDTLKALREGVPPAQLKGLAPNDMMKRLTRNSAYDKMLNDYLEPTD